MTSAQAAPATTPTATKDVTFLAHTFKVPSDWPVIDLSADPTACVRFDHHAVYLGTPGLHQACPARLVGHTEALLVQPDGNNDPATTTVSAIDRQVRATASGIKATGVYDKDQGLVRSILASAGFPADATTAPRSGAKAATTVQPAVFMTGATTAQPAALTATASALPADATKLTGNGFDACSAPDANTMSAWKASSPYQAIGVYIGGADRACSQPNLTAAWMQQQYSAGWRFLPLYVGLQASQIGSPTSDGTAAADDAVAKASALGLPTGSVLYYDMENYNVSTYSATVQSFLSAWTKELHAQGYNSAVYSSANSGIADLVNSSASGNGYVMPDVLFTARWNGVADTSEPVIPSNAWSNHQRVHQYQTTTETWGGVTINIDQDYLDAQVNTTPNGNPTTPGIYRSSTRTFAFADSSGNVTSAVTFGNSGDIPLTGHFAGPGRDTIGIYRPSAASFYFTTDNATVSIAVPFGNPGDIPLVGDWTGQGKDTIGIYRPADGAFYLTNDNATVSYSIRLGNPGDVPIVGNWSGTGKDTVGLYRPSTNGFYLSNSNTSVNIDHSIVFGNTGDTPIKGDWNGNGADKVGIFRSSAISFYGTPDDSASVIYSLHFGASTDTPLAGHWH